MMKPSQRILQSLQGLFGNDVGAGDVAELEKSSEATHNLGGNMALDGRQVNLRHE